MDNKKSTQTRSWFGNFMSMMFGERLGGKMSLAEEEQVQSPFRTIVREFFRRKLTIIGLTGFFSVLLASIVIPFFFPMELTDTDAGQANVRPGRAMMRIPRDIRGNIRTMDAGAGYGIAVTYQGDIHAWGVVSGIAEPLMRPPQTNRNIVQVSAGYYHALAVTECGYVYAWGNPNPAFVMLDVPPAIQGNIRHVSAGMRTSVAIDKDGNLHSWGGVELDRRDTAAVGRVPRTENPIQIESNIFTFGVLTEEGNLYVLMRTPRGIRDIPDEVQGRVVDFAMTDHNGIALLNDGTVAIWGDSLARELFDIPAGIQGRIIGVGAGREHFTALLTDGSVVSWGSDRNGRTNAPAITDGVGIFVAGDHNYVLRADGTITTWGLSGFIFGTDHWGRCIFTRMWHAGRYSLLIGMVAVFVQGSIGLFFGGMSGFYGGKLDMFLMRLAEVVGSLPFLPIALIIQFRFRHLFDEVQGMMFLMFVLGALSWPPLMRLVRAQILQARESEYVLAARALGVRQFKLIFRHILPNVISAAIVLLTLALAGSMLTETTLSFIGFGVREPVPTWGNMLSGAQSSVVLRDMWWRWIFPAVALVTVAISINLVGDGLREATDPRAQGR